MRIVAGRFKGRPLTAPKGRGTRPTADRTREAIFNTLTHAGWGRPLEGARVIDLFAGSGALGFEALSRGAAFCLFVETEAAARGAIRENVERFELWGATRLHRRDAARLGEKPAALGAPFDLAFLDPPYGLGLGPIALARLLEGGWMAPNALAMLETGADERVEPLGWTRLDARPYGAARIWFLSPNAANAPEGF